MPPPRRSSTSTSTSTIGAWVLAALVVAAPLARGGVDLPVQLIAAALAGAALLLLTRGGERGSAAVQPRVPMQPVTRPAAAMHVAEQPAVAMQPVVAVQPAMQPGAQPVARRLARSLPRPSSVQSSVPLPLAALPLLLVLAWSALQLLPLSGGVAISLDPPASGRELAGAAARLLAFLAGFAVAGTRRRRELVLVAFGLSGLAVALVVLGAALLGLGPLLEPRAPFVNPNHLSGFLCLTAFPVLGLALRRHGQARLLWLMGFVVVVAALFVSLSRGGIGAFFGGVAVFLLLAAWQVRPDGEPPHPWRWAALAGLSVALGAVAYLALEPVVRELSTLRTAGEDEKLGFWRPALALLREHPLGGIGRGSFVTVFPALKTDPAVTTYTHLENEWLQPLVDLGLPVGLLLVVTLGLGWLAAARRRDLSSVEVGLLAGTAAVAAQNLVDFSLEFSGVGVPFMVALGLLTRGGGGGGRGGGGDGEGSRSGGSERLSEQLGGLLGWRPRLRWRWLAAGVAATLLLAGAGAAFWRAHPTEEEALAVARAPDAAAAAALADEALRWHRADYVPAATVGARWVLEGRCAPAMPWLTRAMALNPTASEPHQYAARCLAAAGQGALARREYRLALLYGSPTALGEAADRFDSVEELLQVVPDTGDGLMALGYLLLSRQRPLDAASVFRRAVEGSLDARALVPLAGALQAAGELEEALEVALRRTAETPGDPQGWRVAAAVLVAEGYDDEARATLERGLTFSPGSPALVEALVYRSLSERRPAEARRLAESMAARTPQEQALRHLLVAATLGAQGRLGEAIERARSAVTALPDSAWPLMALASYCQQGGRIDDAIAAVERASSLPGQRREDYQARLDELAKARAAQAERRMTEELLK
jgi:Flp pilus assembly protein TadD